MEQENQEMTQTTEEQGPDLRSLIRETIHEYLASEKAKAEPAYKAELVEERRRREQLERRVNELIAENERSRRLAEEAERSAAIRDELRRLGVTKVELGYRAVKDDIYRTEDGRLVARTEGGEMSLQDYLAKFTKENPELLPARIPGGSGAASASEGLEESPISLDAIKPGMDPEHLNRIRKQIAQAIARSLR